MVSIGDVGVMVLLVGVCIHIYHCYMMNQGGRCLC